MAHRALALGRVGRGHAHPARALAVIGHVGLWLDLDAPRAVGDAGEAAEGVLGEREDGDLLRARRVGGGV